jgi:hypothetical protein
MHAYCWPICQNQFVIYLLKENPLGFIGFGPLPFSLCQLGDVHYDILATQKAGTAITKTTKIWAINQLERTLFFSKFLHSRRIGCAVLNSSMSADT